MAKKRTTDPEPPGRSPSTPSPTDLRHQPVYVRVNSFGTGRSVSPFLVSALSESTVFAVHPPDRMTTRSAEIFGEAGLLPDRQQTGGVALRRRRAAPPGRGSDVLAQCPGRTARTFPCAPFDSWRRRDSPAPPAHFPAVRADLRDLHNKGPKRTSQICRAEADRAVSDTRPSRVPCAGEGLAEPVWSWRTRHATVVPTKDQGRRPWDQGASRMGDQGVCFGDRRARTVHA